MEQYDKNVTVILEFLIAENFSTSVISLHRLCYKALRKHLIEEKILYSSDAAYRWIDDNKACWTYRQYTGWKHCVDQLEDVYTNGSYYLSTWVQGVPHTATVRNIES